MLRRSSFPLLLIATLLLAPACKHEPPVAPSVVNGDDHGGDDDGDDDHGSGIIVKPASDTAQVPVSNRAINE